MPQITLDPVNGTSRLNLIDNGDFSRGSIGGMPDGWTIVARNPVLAPLFALVEDQDGRHALRASGNGRDECFGWVQSVVTLKANSHYRLSVRFHMEGLDDVNRYLVHAIHSIADDGSLYNYGVFSYKRQGGQIVGESVFAGPVDDCEVTVRLCLRNSARGCVWWDHVSLEACDPPPSRLVKIAVMQGLDGLDHWELALEEAGQAGCDVALLPEMYDQNNDPMKAPTMDGPAVKMLSRHAVRHGMYVSGAIYIRRGDIVYNSAPLFDRQGNLVGIHDKNILYEPETDHGATCGTEMLVYQTDFGKVGIMTCYEIWYPAVAQLLALKGAEMILFPSAGYYTETLYARSSDNGVVIAASSQGGTYDVWDSGGNRAGGEAHPDPTRNAPTNVVTVERRPAMRMMFATVDLSKQPSPHSWGGPMKSAPGGRRVRNACPVYLEDEISRQVRRWE